MGVFAIFLPVIVVVAHVSRVPGVNYNYIAVCHLTRTKMSRRVGPKTPESKLLIFILSLELEPEPEILHLLS